MKTSHLVRSGFVFAVGVLAGMKIPAWFTPADAVATQGSAALSPEERVRALKLELPPVQKPANTFANTVRVGDMLYVSGTGPGKVDGKLLVGRLGADFDVPRGRDAARRVGLQMLSVVKAELGSLDKVERLVKTFGMVNGTADFKQQPEVINGFSDLMVEVFGDRAGLGARSSVGMAALPGGIPVEIEAIFQVHK